VEEGQLVREGERRWTRYRLPAGEPEVLAKAAPVEVEVEFVTPVSPAGEEIRAYLRQPEGARKPVGYLQSFDDGTSPSRGCPPTFPSSKATSRRFLSPKCRVTLTRKQFSALTR